MAERRADIVIPVHNAPRHFVPCIQSIVRWSPEELCSLYVADDASDDESRALLENLADELQGWGPRIEILRSDENMGFLRTCNAAMRRTGGEFVLLVNSDVVVTPGWLEKMLRCADSDARMALVNPLDNTSSVFETGLVPGANFRSVAEAVARIEPRYPDVCPATGFCLMIRREALDEAGPFDEAYGRGWYEDIDLYMRLVTSGWRAAVADDAYVYHRGEASFDRSEGHAELERNRELFESRWDGDYFPRLERVRNSRAIRHVTRLFGGERREVVATVLRHLPLVFLGHPRRAVYRIRKDLAAPASIVNPTRRFLCRFTIDGAPSVIFVLGSALSGAAYERLRRLANALILRDVDCRVLTMARQDDRAPRDSYFGAALYTSARRLTQNLPPADFVCVLPPGAGGDAFGDLADQASRSPHALAGEDVARLLGGRTGDLRVLRGDNKELGRRLRTILAGAEDFR